MLRWMVEILRIYSHIIEGLWKTCGTDLGPVGHIPLREAFALITRACRLGFISDGTLHIQTHAILSTEEGEAHHLPGFGALSARGRTLLHENRKKFVSKTYDVNQWWFELCVMEFRSLSMGNDWFLTAHFNGRSLKSSKHLLIELN